MAGSEENSTGGLSLPDDVAGRRCAENAITAHEDLLHAIRGSNLGDQLDDLGVVVTAVTANDEEGIFGAFGNGLEEGCDEVLGVVLLLEDLDLLAEAGAVRGGTSVVALESWSLVRHQRTFRAFGHLRDSVNSELYKKVEWLMKIGTHRRPWS